MNKTQASILYAEANKGTHKRVITGSPPVRKRIQRTLSDTQRLFLEGMGTSPVDGSPGRSKPKLAQNSKSQKAFCRARDRHQVKGSFELSYIEPEVRADFGIKIVNTDMLPAYVNDRQERTHMTVEMPIKGTK